MNENDSSSGTRISERILQILQDKPNLRARQIANSLEIDRNLVNSALYGELRTKVVQDNQYRWSLKGVSLEADINERSDVEYTPLSKLCDYYLDCLDYDNVDGQSVFASSNYDLDYVELPELPMVSDAPSDLFEDENSHKLWRRVRRERSQSTLLLGYPIYLRKTRGRSGWEGCFVEPIFLFGFSKQESQQHEIPRLSEDFPHINFKAIRSLTDTNDPNIIDEVVSLAEELGLADISIDSPEIDELLPRLKEIRPDWNWKEYPDVYAIKTTPPISDLTDPGIYNRAILLKAKRSPYTVGLETELTMLKNVSRREYEKSSLGQWLSDEDIINDLPDNEPLLEVIPLNSEQREAVLKGLNNPMTIITGPPGTGKSQIVTSLLIHATLS